MTQDLPNLDQRFAEAMGQLLGPDFPDEIGLAVSGGGDSMAMLALAHNWTRVWGVKLRVVTVDHGLRPESGDEAAMVAAECKTLGWPHDTRKWQWTGDGNLQDQARIGRLEIFDTWRGNMRHVLVGHTRDDLAETFLMRLKRGSGVDGLSAMLARRDVVGVDGHFELLRPCLDMRRSELRHYLTVLKTPWADDPSNDDTKYDRVKMRQLLVQLEDEGLGVDRLAETANRLRRAQEALRSRAVDVWRQVGREGATEFGPTGDILFDRDKLAEIERETQLRVMAAALQYVSGKGYRPREAALDSVLELALSGGHATLMGCEIRVEHQNLRIFPELNAIQDRRLAPNQGAVWDHRWSLAAPLKDGQLIAPLGEDGWQQIADKKAMPVPYHAARSLPALWEAGQLRACDPLGIGEQPTVQLYRSHSFDRFLLSH
ncbi:tRNA lysidine(34) synthetase TilS [uncultured Pelagimonas sp.]|uniref:tRNA lysidine(34) synthetase TilS n=1 Tax=uncultured Pelagimonas sp. TaxID=1618102 RepID=UPI00261BCC03|nr:tRNA lysidine(34) synthetase TilS [uncultured Pelagimonas sp.]